MTDDRRILHLDLSTGASGDKLLAALLDLGDRLSEQVDDVAAGTTSATLHPGLPDALQLQATLAPLVPEARIEVETAERCGIGALGLRVTGGERAPARHWRDINAALLQAELPGDARLRALRAFELLAAAEARVHGVDAEDVHFHEVGATDSIADVVGVSVMLAAIGAAEIVVTPPALGGGTVLTSHGELPVPAPATAELLLGWPTLPGPTAADGSPLGELTTPTGAALVAANATSVGPIPPMTPLAIGYGAGSRELGVAPNVVRAILGEPLGEPLALQPITLLETNVDHVSPERTAFAAEELRRAGALDVWLTPVVMKKGRAGLLVSVLADAGLADALATRLHQLTGTLGVRRRDLQRSVVPREVVTVETAWGPARVKCTPNADPRPEHDDVARISRERGVPFDVVREEVMRAAAEL